jgi:hypothetical protein
MGSPLEIFVGAECGEILQAGANADQIFLIDNALFKRRVASDGKQLVVPVSRA